MFRRLGMPFGEFNRFNRFGMGQNPGAELIRCLNFENNLVIDDPTGFDSTAGVAGNLAVTAASALAGNYGFAVTANGAGSEASGIVSNLSEVSRFRFSFLFDFRTLTMPAGNDFVFLYLLDGAAIPVDMRYRENAIGNPEFRFAVRDDGGAGSAQTVAIPEKHGLASIFYRASSSPGEDDGEAELIVDGQRIAIFQTQDTDTYAIDGFRLGTIAGVDAGTSNFFSIDNICLWRI